MKKAIILVLVGILIFSSFVFLSGCAKKENVIKIGVILPLTGEMASYGLPVRNGMELAVEEINNNDGINGKKIDLIIEDDAGDSKKSVNAFNKLININTVPIILGPLSSGCSMATAPISEKNKVVQLSILAGIPMLSQAGDYIFRIYPSSELGATFSAEFAIDYFKPERIAIMYGNNPFGEAAQKIYKEIALKKGKEIVVEQRFTDSSDDFKTQLTKIKKSNPDILLCSAYWIDGAKILKQMAELGLNIPVIGEDGWKGPIAEIVGKKSLENLYIIDIDFNNKTNSNKIMETFSINYEEKYKKESSTHAAAGYDAVYIAKKVIIESGIIPEKIKDSLYKIDYNGALGNIRFDENGDNIGVKFAVYQLDINNNAHIFKY